MCLGELAEVTRVRHEAEAEVRVDGRALSVSPLTLHEPVVPGDWLVVHSGFALSRLTPEEAREARRIRTSLQEEHS